MSMFDNLFSPQVFKSYFGSGNIAKASADTAPQVPAVQVPGLNQAQPQQQPQQAPGAQQQQRPMAQYTDPRTVLGSIANSGAPNQGSSGTTTQKLLAGLFGGQIPQQQAPGVPAAPGYNLGDLERLPQPQNSSQPTADQGYQDWEEI